MSGTVPLWKQQLLLKQKREQEMHQKEKDAKDAKLKQMLSDKPSPGLNPDYYSKIATLHARGSKWTDDGEDDGGEWNMFRRQIKQRKQRGEKLKFPIKPSSSPRGTGASPRSPGPAGGRGGGPAGAGAGRGAMPAPSPRSAAAAAQKPTKPPGPGQAKAPSPAPKSDADAAPPIPQTLTADQMSKLTSSDGAEKKDADLESESWDSSDEESRLPPEDCSASGTALLKSMIAKEINNEVVKSHSARFSVGYADTRGTRKTMEDRMAVVGCYIDDTADYFGVFDGHGGIDVANHVCETLHARLYEKLRQAEDKEGGGGAAPGPAVQAALTEAFTELQSEIEESDPPMMGGSTCAVTLAYHSTLYAANCGDARSILVYPDGKVQRLSKDHKPQLPEEKERIEKEGGFVTTVTTRSGITISRVCGAIAVSRAFGDVGLQPFLIADPFVSEPIDFEATGPSLMVLACDGVWDVLEDEEVGALALTIGDPEKAALKLRNKAYASGSTDNISVMVIHFPGHAPAPPPPMS